MTLAELRKMIEATSREFDSLEVKTWLPGSTIRLSPMILDANGGMKPHKGFLHIEGNVDPGSALSAGLED